MWLRGNRHFYKFEEYLRVDIETTVTLTLGLAFMSTMSLLKFTYAISLFSGVKMSLSRVADVTKGTIRNKLQFWL